jgi:hypothetical protein
MDVCQTISRIYPMLRVPGCSAQSDPLKGKRKTDPDPLPNPPRESYIRAFYLVEELFVMLWPLTAEAANGVPAGLGYEEDKRSVQAKLHPQTPPDPDSDLRIGTVTPSARVLTGTGGRTDPVDYHIPGGGEKVIDIEAASGWGSVTCSQGDAGRAVLGRVSPEEAALLRPAPNTAEDPDDPDADEGAGNGGPE